MKKLILGGVRSGKSCFAELCAQETKQKLFYVATAEALDSDMAERIEHHKSRRSDEWTTIVAPCQLAGALEGVDSTEHAVVVDCLTLWLSNCLIAGNLKDEKTKLLEVISALSCDLFLVSNEVGSGVVPLGKLSRQFVDESGWLHQRLAALCDSVTLVVAGLPLELKGV